MKDISVLISGIYYKIKLLVEKNAELTKEIESLKHQNFELNEKLTRQKDELASLKQENDVIKITKTISSEDDRRQTKVIIEDLVREIDNSLNLLNK
jgi:Tfp pilus assembly protein PilN